MPKNLRIVTREQLEELANAATTTKKSTRNAGGSPVVASEVEDFLKRAAIDVKSTHELSDGGKKWVLAQCWFIPEHKDAAVFTNSAGVLTYCCFHQSCGHNTNRWKEFLESVEAKVGERFDLPRGSSIPYELTPAGIIHNSFTRHGDKVQKPLTNFTARIVANIEVDDGVETKNNLEIEAALRNRTKIFSVPSSVWSANLSTQLLRLYLTTFRFAPQHLKPAVTNSRSFLKLSSCPLPRSNGQFEDSSAALFGQRRFANRNSPPPLQNATDPQNNAAGATVLTGRANLISATYRCF